MTNMNVITGSASRTYRAFTAKIQYAILIYPAHCACLECYKRTKLITRTKYTLEVTYSEEHCQ